MCALISPLLRTTAGKDVLVTIFYNRCSRRETAIASGLARTRVSGGREPANRNLSERHQQHLQRRISLQRMIDRSVISSEALCRRAKCKSTAEITFKKRRTARYSASKPHVAFASTAPWVCAVRRCRAHLRSHLDALTHPGNGARGRIDQHCSCGVHGRLSYRICSRWPFRPTDEPLASASDLCNY